MNPARRLVANAPVPFADWLWALPFLLVGVAFSGLALFFVIAALTVRNQVGGHYGVGIAIFGVAGLGTLAAALSALPKRTTLTVAPDAGTVVSKTGRPLLWKFATTIPMREIGGVVLSRADLHVSTTRILFRQTERFRRFWHVKASRSGSAAAETAVFKTTRERQARWVAERVAAAAHVPLLDQTGMEVVTRAPEELNAPLVDLIRSGRIQPRVPAESSGAIRTTRREVENCYEWVIRGRVLERSCGVTVGPGGIRVWSSVFGPVSMRGIRLDEVEQLLADHRVRRSRLGLRGRSQTGEDLLRIVSDRRVLEVPVPSAGDGVWLVARLMTDIGAASHRSRFIQT